MFWDTLLFTAGVTLPVCVMLLSGILLKRWRVIDDHFITTASRLVFNICMPALLFTSVINLDMDSAFDGRLIVFCVVASVVAFITARVLAGRICETTDDYGAFIQGGARANLAIVGMALAGNLYGREGIALISLVMAFLVPLYNVLSVLALTYYAPEGGNASFRWHKLVADLVKNPLIMSIVVGALFSASGAQLPVVIEKVSNYFAQITLPLALISIGGSLSIETLKKTSASSIWATVHKTCLMPLFAVPVARLLVFKEVELGIIFLVFACPTAAASFVMTKAMGGNATLTANIVALTTLVCLPATAIGIFTLEMLHII